MYYRISIGQYTLTLGVAKRRPLTRVERVKIALSDTVTALKVATQNRDVAQRVVERVNHLRMLSERVQRAFPTFGRSSANRTVNGVTFINVQFK